jgi:TM2 domain-containing membrane protein YozV
MECTNHAGIETDNICMICRKPVCPQCAVELKNSFYCKECLENKVENAANNRAVLCRPRKSKLLTFFLSIMPGVGHMYLGLINKGLAIMCLLFASLFLVILFSGESSMSWFPGFFIPTLSIAFVSYSIFDSLDIAEKINSGRTDCYDNTLEPAIIKQKLHENRKLIGFIFLILGAISICNMAFGYLEYIIRALLGINLSLTSLLLALIFVAFGLSLIRKSSQ